MAEFYPIQNLESRGFELISLLFLVGAVGGHYVDESFYPLLPDLVSFMFPILLFLLELFLTFDFVSNFPDVPVAVVGTMLVLTPMALCTLFTGNGLLCFVEISAVEAVFMCGAPCVSIAPFLIVLTVLAGAVRVFLVLWTLVTPGAVSAECASPFVSASEAVQTPCTLSVVLADIKLFDSVEVEITFVFEA